MSQANRNPYSPPTAAVTTAPYAPAPPWTPAPWSIWCGVCLYVLSFALVNYLIRNGQRLGSVVCRCPLRYRRRLPPPQEAQLALLSHRWMLGEAYAAGLQLDEQETLRQICPPDGVRADCCADMHESLTRWWNLAEWVPQRVWTSTRAVRSWHIGSMPPFGKPRPRKIKPGVRIHHSVERRLNQRSNYRPVNLPDDRAVIDDSPMRWPT
jgi:hypothetical protein